MSDMGRPQHQNNGNRDNTPPDINALWDTLRGLRDSVRDSARDSVADYRPGTKEPEKHDLHAAILGLLAEGPRHGAQIIRDIAERSNDGWAPGAAEVYPMLQLLVDEGLAIIAEEDGRRTYSLSEAGHIEATPLGGAGGDARDTEGDLGEDSGEDSGESPGEGAEWTPPWLSLMARTRWAESRGELPKAGVKLGQAVRQVAISGDEQQRARVATLLNETRRRIYGILAEDTDADQGPSSPDPVTDE